MKQWIITALLCLLTLSMSAEFDIKRFTEPSKYQWNDHEERMSFRQDLLQRQKLLQIYEMHKQDVTSNMLKSALVPGWGHFAAQHYNKGTILLASEVVLFGTGLFYLDKAMDTFSKYENATYIADIKQLYTDANDDFRVFQSFMGLGLLVWGYTLYDTIVVTEEYNASVWQRIVRDSRQRVSLGPGCITVRF